MMLTTNNTIMEDVEGRECTFFEESEQGGVVDKRGSSRI